MHLPPFAVAGQVGDDEGDRGQMNRRVVSPAEPPAAVEPGTAARNHPVVRPQSLGMTHDPCDQFPSFLRRRNVGLQIAPQPEKPGKILIVGGSGVTRFAVHAESARDETGRLLRILKLHKSPDGTAGGGTKLFRGRTGVLLAEPDQIEAGEEAAVFNRRPPAERVGPAFRALLRGGQNDLAGGTGVIIEHPVRTGETPFKSTAQFRGAPQEIVPLSAISGDAAEERAGDQQHRNTLHRFSLPDWIPTKPFSELEKNSSLVRILQMERKNFPPGNSAAQARPASMTVSLFTVFPWETGPPDLKKKQSMLYSTTCINCI